MPTLDATFISADDHLDLNVLPPDLFTSRVPSRLADQAPKVVPTDDGPHWTWEGELQGPSGRKAAGLVREDAHKFRPGTPATRLEDMDLDGVQTQIIYGPPGGMGIKDPELRIACIEAYNDFLVEFNGSAPDRLVALAALPSGGPEEASAELARVAALGHRGAVLEQFDSPVPIFEDPWQPFWDAAADAGIPIHVHLGGGFHSIKGAPNSWRRVAAASVVPLQLDELLAGMVLSGTLERRPGLRFVMGESGLAWIRYVVERMDEEHHKYHDQTRDHRLSRLPSEIFSEQVFVTFEHDDLGLELLEPYGLGNVMWASDYPHGDTTWPESRSVVAGSRLGTYSPDLRRQITGGTAAQLYGLPAPDAVEAS